MSVVVTFKLDAFVQMHAERREQPVPFDQALGNAFVAVAKTPQVWWANETHPPEFGVGLELVHASRWRTIFQNVRAAAKWISILTASPAVQILAESILDRYLAPNTGRVVSIHDVLVDGVPAEKWLEQLDAEDRDKARQAILEAAAKANVHGQIPAGAVPWYLRIFESPISTIFVLLVVAALWSAGDALIRKWVQGDAPPATRIEIGITLPHAIVEAPQPRVQQPPPMSHGAARRCASVRVQRGTTVRTECPQ